jgi:hypothetical protein
MLFLIVLFLALIFYLFYSFMKKRDHILYHVLIVPNNTNFKPMIDHRPLIILNQSDFTYASNNEKDVYVFRIMDKKITDEKDYETLIKSILGNKHFKLYLDI